MDFSDKKQIKKLIGNCRKGDRKSQHFLYKTFYGKMLGLCMRYASDNDEAKDILHEGFIKVFGKLDKFRNEGSLEGWIRRIMINTALDYIKSTKKLLSIESELSDIDSAIDDPDDNKILAMDVEEIIQ